MTPNQIQLARAAIRLPGAPERWSDPHGMPHREHDTGILWVFTGDPGDRLPCEWLPDLSDAATGGALFAALGEGVTVYRDGEVVNAWSAGVGASGGTLAEVCCHLALKLGRWPGGAP